MRSVFFVLVRLKWRATNTGGCHAPLHGMTGHDWPMGLERDTWHGLATWPLGHDGTLVQRTA